MAEAKPRGRLIDRVRERKEKHKQRHLVYRVTVAIVGGLVILAGALLSLPGVPGPGLLLIAVGLGLLALEFDRAERLLERVLDTLERAGEQASKASPLQKALGGIVVVALAVGAIAAVVFWDVPYLPG
jgi:uncharacterized protein (TIGR02611 family)